jgi:GT2 family glycosyltransferase/2-polyprenyl-3-methyl-5-hydroxy-6-metoxy-1,4-benzoquinol methylase
MLCLVIPLRPTAYFRYLRQEILAEIPTGARSILDVGCGAGVLGEWLRRRQQCEVWGIERDPDAAREARERLDRVLDGSVEAVIGDLPAAYFDTLIAADILEHLPDPWAALRALARCVAPNATIVISLPNVQHHAVVRDLLRGRFTYAPDGVLNHTHLRFFTRRTAVDLVRRAGFALERLVPLYVSETDRRAAERGRIPPDLPLPPDVQLEDLYAAGFLLVARAQTAQSDTHDVRVSVVMLTYNRLDLTEPAVASVRATTGQPHELIIVDNGSTDGTPAYLDSLAQQGVRVIKNAVNRGVAAGWNQGLRVATGDCLMVLNNDVIVSGDWLARMTRAAYQVPGAGLVGCRTNAVSGPQALAPDYDDVSDFPVFARRYGALADGSWFELPRVVGFAMLWRRDVYERVGEFDEQFGPANFEDDDYAARTLRAGYRNIVANDVFIHHIGAASHAANNLSVEALVDANRDRFVAKWGALAAPFMAAVWTAYREHIAALAPEQYALPSWAIPDLPPLVLARHFARAGRRLARMGWRTEADAAFRRSLAAAVTVGGVAGWMWNLLPRGRR